MKPLGYALRTAVLLGVGVACLGIAAGRFDQKLPIDKQAIHVLNRLTFGPRPGDVEQVRRIGIEKWIDQQLHPEQISENPLLETKMKRLTTLRLETWQILEQYPQAPVALMIRPPASNVLQQTTRLMNSSIEERKSMLASMDPELRKGVLANAPPPLLEGLPAEVQEEAANARKADQEERQKEQRKLRPPLNELLTPDQIRVARNGTREEKLALINSFETEKRQQIIRALGRAGLSRIPELRREAMVQNQPQQRRQYRTDREQALSRDLFQPATGRSPRRFLDEPLQRVQRQRTGSRVAHQLRT